MTVRALLVEDEPHARESLREYASEVDWLELVGEAADGASAAHLIDTLRPDLVFLDVCLPEMSGLQVIERIRHTPEIVFTTAFDRFALAAFEVGALDYLLKPFGRKRFQTTLQRVHQRIGDAVPPRERARAAFGTPWRRLFARTHKGIVPVEVRSIRRIEASGDYVAIHGEGGRGKDWTKGCVALTNRDIEDLFRRVSVGTPVTIVGTDGSGGSLGTLLVRQQQASTPGTGAR